MSSHSWLISTDVYILNIYVTWRGGMLAYAGESWDCFQRCCGYLCVSLSFLSEIYLECNLDYRRFCDVNVGAYLCMCMKTQFTSRSLQRQKYPGASRTNASSPGWVLGGFKTLIFGSKKNSRYPVAVWYTLQLFSPSRIVSMHSHLTIYIKFAAAKIGMWGRAWNGSKMKQYTNIATRFLHP